MEIMSQDVLRWLHIIAMVYWLGGEWGVFQTSYHVTNGNLPLEERRRHMETAYRIDILARTGIIMLLPLGFHMGFNLGAHELGGWVMPVWVLCLLWLGLCWAAFFTRDTDRGLMITKLDEAIRFVVIPLLVISATWSLVGDGPFLQGWYSAKVLIYGLMLVIGLALRFIMRHWVTIFRAIAANGNTPELQGRLDREIAMGRMLAYVYWIGIGSVAFLGATKPFY